VLIIELKPPFDVVKPTPIYIYSTFSMYNFDITYSKFIHWLGIFKFTLGQKWLTLLDEIGMFMVIGRPTFYMVEKTF
jgi:hypothetical protein